MNRSIRLPLDVSNMFANENKRIWLDDERAHCSVRFLLYNIYIYYKVYADGDSDLYIRVHRCIFVDMEALIWRLRVGNII